MVSDLAIHGWLQKALNFSPIGIAGQSRKCGHQLPLPESTNLSQDGKKAKKGLMMEKKRDVKQRLAKVPALGLASI